MKKTAYIILVLLILFILTGVSVFAGNVDLKTVGQKEFEKVIVNDINIKSEEDNYFDIGEKVLTTEEKESVVGEAGHALLLNGGGGAPSIKWLRKETENLTDKYLGRIQTGMVALTVASLIVRGPIGALLATYAASLEIANLIVYKYNIRRKDRKNMSAFYMIASRLAIKHMEKKFKTDINGDGKVEG